jgi:hypothetical protein
MEIYRQLTLSPIYVLVFEASTGMTGCSLNKRFNQGGNSMRIDPADTQLDAPAGSACRISGAPLLSWGKRHFDHHLPRVGKAIYEHQVTCYSRLRCTHEYGPTTIARGHLVRCARP